MNASIATTVSALDNKTFSGEFFSFELIHLEGSSFQIITRYDNSPRADWKSIVDSSLFADEAELAEFGAEVQREEAASFWASLGDAVEGASYTVATLDA